MKYIFKYIITPFFNLFVMMIFTGIFVAFFYFIWHFSFKGCPVFEQSFWYDGGVYRDWYGRDYTYDSLKNRILERRTYLETPTTNDDE